MIKSIQTEKISTMELSKITVWSKSNDIRFNEGKSTVMLISRNRKETKYIKVYLNNRPLQQVNTMKYLGIIIQNKFKFSEYIKYGAERSIKLIHS
jgi:hypothetical protein